MERPAQTVSGAMAAGMLAVLAPLLPVPAAAVAGSVAFDSTWSVLSTAEGAV